MACNWVVMRSSHCPYLVRIESNADFLSRFYGWLENQPIHPRTQLRITKYILYSVAFEYAVKFKYDKKLDLVEIRVHNGKLGECCKI